MKTIWKRVGYGVLLAAVYAANAMAHENHSEYSAGEPGDPKKPSREIVVLMSEMDYSPASIEVKRGEQIRFVVRNVGTEVHEFLLATTAENLKHGEAMKKNRLRLRLRGSPCERHARRLGPQSHGRT